MPALIGGRSGSTRSIWPTSPQLPERRRRAFRPQPHGHLAEQGRRRREVLAGELPLAGAQAERSEPEMAAGRQRAHPEVIGEWAGLAPAVPGLLALEPVRMGGELGGEPQRPGLVPPLL